VTSLERVQDLGQLELLVKRLPELVGAPLSVNALREDLQVSHKTASSWIQILERLFAVFRLAPFGAPRIRAVKKEQKHYQFDWATVPAAGPRFENLVACHLLKWIQFEQDARGRDVDLRYLRDSDGREVDFIITEGRKPIRLIECKLAARDVDPSLRYLKARFPSAEAWQLSDCRDFMTPDGIRVAPALTFLRTLA
jgi:predicted AAA+ superfamily ATPase